MWRPEALELGTIGVGRPSEDPRDQLVTWPVVAVARPRLRARRVVQVNRDGECRMQPVVCAYEHVIGDAAQAPPPRAYSHSIVPGGFEEMSSATRLTPRTSLMIRFETRSSRS